MPSVAPCSGVTVPPTVVEPSAFSVILAAPAEPNP